MQSPLPIRDGEAAPNVIVPIWGKNGEAAPNVIVPIWGRNGEEAPEKTITMLAAKIAFLEIAATTIGTSNFIWATAVLLGGFAATLSTVDFWFVSGILVAEGTRIFARSSELLGGVTSRRSSYRGVHRYLNFMKCYGLFVQEYSAWICLLLAFPRLMHRLFGWNMLAPRFSPTHAQTMHNMTQKWALNIFYGLSTIEAVMITTVIFWKLIVRSKPLWGKEVEGVWKVNREYNFDKSQLDTVRRFFYDTHSRCINGNVLDGLKMEFVSYGLELLQSSDGDEQLTGARLLSALLKSDRLELRTEAIGTLQGVVERLIEMLNWKKFHEQEIRTAAAEIISKLVQKKRNRSRVTVIAGSMESIASLLYDDDKIDSHSSKQPEDRGTYNYFVFSLQGLQILESLAKDQNNCTKIRSNRRLLLKIIGLTNLSPNGAYEIQSRTRLEILAIDTLTSLAREQEGRESIGVTGGVLHNLFSLFFMERIDNNDETKELVIKAGEALGFLSLENKQNCEIIMSIDLEARHPNSIVGLISVLNDPVQGIHVARVLRNLLAYAEADCVQFRDQITATAAQVVGFVMEKQGEHQEAAIGLAAQIFKDMTELDFEGVFINERRAAIKGSLISKLVEVFREHPRPSKEVPSIRRFSIELLIAVMKMDRSTIEIEKILELKKALEGVMKAPSELESYTAVRSLVKSAMVLLDAEMNIRTEGGTGGSDEDAVVCSHFRI